MVKWLVFLIFIEFNLISSTLDISKFFYDKREYLDLRLSSKSGFECKEVIDYSLKTKIICDLKFDTNISKEFELFYLDINDSLKITPKYRYKIISFKVDGTFFKNIIFFKDKSPFFNQNQNLDGLDFKVDYKINHNFYIPVLNDDLTPKVKIDDAHKLLFAKKLYQKGDFDSVVKFVDKELEKENRFESDLMLLKLKALDKILDDKYEKKYSYDDIKDLADLFLEKFPSNKNYTQVAFYKIKALFKMGKKKSAIKLLDNLKSSFEGDFYVEKSLIQKAKFFSYSKREDSKKILYDLLYSTKHIDIALKSAYLLTKYNLLDNDTDEAKKYIKKILFSKPEYLLKDLKDSYNLAKKFASLKDYKDAVKIAKVLSKIKKDEEFLKNYAWWLDKAGLKDDGYKAYKKYLKTYPNGRYVEFVKERIQKILLDVNETNSSKKLSDIENVMKKYKNDPIYKKALLKKVELLKSENRFENILEMEQNLKDINRSDYIDFAAKKLFDRYASKNDCQKMILIVDKYEIKIDNENKLFMLSKCYYDFSMYKESSEIALKFLKNSNDDNEIQKWYYLAIKSLIKLKDFKEAQILFSDFEKLIDIDNSKYKDIYYQMLKVYINLNEKNKIFEAVEKIEKLFLDAPKNLDVYYQVLKYLIKNKESDLLIVYYAKKLLKLQKKLKVFTYSVEVDILLIKSLIKLNKNKEALKYFADAYLDKNKTDVQKSQLLFLAGEASLNLGKKEQAKEFFSKCGSETKSKMWLKLCSESLKLIDEE